MSALDLAWETVEMNPETKEAAQDSIYRAKAQRVVIFDEGQWQEFDLEIEDNMVNLNQEGLMTGEEGTATIIKEEQDAECLTCHRPWQEGIKITVASVKEVVGVWAGVGSA